MEIIDAKGLSCPEPVVLLKNAMKSGEHEYTLITDNTTSKENTTRYGEKMGYTVSVSEEKGIFTLKFTK